MEVLAQKTLAQIVTENYKAAEILGKYELDFCCKGKISLEKACFDNNVNLSNILSELGLMYSVQTDVLSRFNTWPLDFLIDYIIINHHEYVKSAMDRLLFYTEKIARVHGTRHEELYDVAELFEAVAIDFQSHMEREETILFPYIKSLAVAKENKLTLADINLGLIETPISQMELEHETSGNIISQIRKYTNNYQAPEDGCNTYRLTMQELAEFERDLHQHVHLENNILFPKAESLEADLKG